MLKSIVSFAKTATTSFINFPTARTITTMAAKYQVVEKGVANSKDFRIFFSKYSFKASVIGIWILTFASVMKKLFFRLN
jgi:hypothetical protein